MRTLWITITMFSVIYLTSCVNSSMYNTSIGQPAKVRTQPEKNTSKPEYTLKQKVYTDTIVNETTEVVKTPIDASKKDSLLTALAKDKQKTPQQKDSIMESFLQSYVKKVVKKDTIIETKAQFDTIYKKSDKKVLLQKTPEELRKMAREDVLEYHSTVEALALPLAGLIGIFAAPIVIPFFGIILSPLFLLGGLSAGIYYLTAKPRIPWTRIKNPYKNDPVYREEYVKYARRRNGAKALIGFIPLALIFITAVAISIAIMMI